MSSEVATTTTPYDSAFYEMISGVSARSASAMVPWITDLLRPSSIIDVGCGTGDWLAAFQAAGSMDVLGIDGDYVDRSKLRIPSSAFIGADLTSPPVIDRRFDLAMSLEVAEHLPEPHAPEFVRYLVGLSDVVLFSAGIPGQGGTDHFNEQWPIYWAALFAHYGYVQHDILRPVFWADERVGFWYRQNAMLFTAGDISREWPQRASYGGASLVHPAQLALATAPAPPLSLRQLTQQLPSAVVHTARRRLRAIRRSDG